MASGIDTSARFISLALNIAVMGFILVEGIASFLRRQLPPAIDAAQLRSLAEQLTTERPRPSDRARPRGPFPPKRPGKRWPTVSAG